MLILITVTVGFAFLAFCAVMEARKAYEQSTKYFGYYIEVDEKNNELWEQKCRAEDAKSNLQQNYADLRRNYISLLGDYSNIVKIENKRRPRTPDEIIGD